MTARGLMVSLAMVLALAVAGSGMVRADALALGGSAPKATTKMKNVDGKKVSIADVAGQKGTLVIFTCNACPYVKAWQDRIVDLGNSYLSQGVGAIAINSNDPSIVEEDAYDVMKDRAAKAKMGFPYVVDSGSEVAMAFGATRTPEVFLFDAKGQLVYHGTIDDNHKEAEKVTKTYLKDALAAVVEGKAVPLAETKAMGCSIKFKKA